MRHFGETAKEHAGQVAGEPCRRGGYGTDTTQQSDGGVACLACPRGAAGAPRRELVAPGGGGIPQRTGRRASLVRADPAADRANLDKAIKHSAASDKKRWLLEGAGVEGML